MVDWFATPEFIKGGLVAIVTVLSASLYLKTIDSRLMSCECPLDSKQRITPLFRLFAALFAICGAVTGASILKMGLAGSPSELVFTLIIFVLIGLVVCFLSSQVFLTSIVVNDDTLTMSSPFGRKHIKLSQIRSISINNRFQLELSDDHGTLRFCHYVVGKRALIEHIVQHSPSGATSEIQELLDKARQRKSSSSKLGML